jgi:hypothetical protein
MKEWRVIFYNPRSSIVKVTRRGEKLTVLRGLLPPPAPLPLLLLLLAPLLSMVCARRRLLPLLLPLLIRCCWAWSRDRAVAYLPSSSSSSSSGTKGAAGGVHWLCPVCQCVCV